MTETGSTRRHLFIGLGLIALIILVQVVVERLMGRVLSLPMHSDLDEATQDRIIAAVASFR